MTAVKIKRSQVQTFLNTTPQSTATYSLIGDGITAGAIAMNPKVTEETYIHLDSASISVDSYAPKLPVEGSAKVGDPAFDYIDGLRRARSVLADCETDIVNVWMYKSGGPTAYPAEKQPVAISVEEFGGEGGVATKIKYTINFVGAAVLGTFNASTKAFTPS
jgi:hypothetical protein